MIRGSRGWAVRLVVVGALLALALPASASAQATRTWVSGVGDDANPCSRTAPCKTWAGAISKTASGGEMNALDDGGFGALTITKPITVDGGGQLASTLASGINGFNININAGGATGINDRVVLRNLDINGTGASGAVGTNTGLKGVNVIKARSVKIVNTDISNFIAVRRPLRPLQHQRAPLHPEQPDSTTTMAPASSSPRPAAAVRGRPCGAATSTRTAAGSSPRAKVAAAPGPIAGHPSGEARVASPL